MKTDDKDGEWCGSDLMRCSSKSGGGVAKAVNVIRRRLPQEPLLTKRLLKAA